MGLVVTVFERTATLAMEPAGAECHGRPQQKKEYDGDGEFVFPRAESWATARPIVANWRRNRPILRVRYSRPRALQDHPPDGR